MSSDKKEEKSVEKLWDDVKKKPADFSAWTLLLQSVEQSCHSSGDVEGVREAFGAFFKRYPYCYGYWKKWADLEKKHTSSGEDEAMQKCADVFEQGLEAIPLSVDLWVQYLAFNKTRYKGSPSFYEKIKALYDRALQVCGQEFRSDRIWDSYIAWETEMMNLKQVTSIYDQLITIPTQLYMHHFEKLGGFLNKYPPHETLPDEELQELKSLYEQKRQDGTLAGGDAASESKSAALENNSGAEDGQESKSETTAEEAMNESTFVKLEAIRKREAIFKKNEEQVGLRWSFEDGIKRPYFHVKPLEKSQLKNWRDYLDLEIERGDEKRTKLLFERCLIACALYEDMWMKYINWAVGCESVEDVLGLYKRACTIHLQKKPSINLAWLAFIEKMEREGKIGDSEYKDVVEEMEGRLQDSVVFSMRRLNSLRRMGDLEKVQQLYKTYVCSAPCPKLSNHFAIKYARFLEKYMDDLSGAVEVLKEGIVREPDNTRLYLAMMDLAIKRGDDRLIEECLESAQKCNELGAKEKLEMMQRKLEYYEEFSVDVDKAQQALEEYAKALKLVEKDKDKKRGADENGAQPDAKKRQEEYTNYYRNGSQSQYSQQQGYQWPQQAYSGYGGQGWNGSNYTNYHY